MDATIQALSFAEFWHGTAHPPPSASPFAPPLCLANYTFFFVASILCDPPTHEMARRVMATELRFYESNN